MTRLIVVTLLLAIVAVVLKSRTKGTKSSRTIRVTSRVTINRGAMVAVVEVDGRRLLVGASATQVNLLSELGENEQPLETDDAPSSTPIGAALASRLSGLRQRPTLKTRPTTVAVPSAALAVEPGGNLIDKVRSMTTRTSEPRLRLPQRSGGLT